MDTLPRTFALRASLLDFSRVAQGAAEIHTCLRHVADGLLFVSNGEIVWSGPWQEGRHRLSQEIPVVDRREYLVMPGFVDTHIHFPQREMVGAYGEQLLTWLDRYTFPAERKYVDAAYASAMATDFIDELLRAGTTSAMVFCAVFPQSVDALFTAALARNMRLIAGKVMMDRNGPDYLLDTPESGYAESRALIEQWHGKNRLLYAITPRFAPTSSAAQLALAGKLLAGYPGVYMQTHLAENTREVAWVKELFPDRANYFDVYDHFGLAGPKSVFAHCIHLEDAEWERIADTGSIMAFCPSSNLFLGSGLFDFQRAGSRTIPVGLGTDVGAGTSFCHLETLGDAYKVMQLQGQSLSAPEALYLATLGGAHALSLDHCIGNFDSGKEADFVVLNLGATPLARLRVARSTTLAETLFALITIGDDRFVAETWVAGQCVYRQ